MSRDQADLFAEDEAERNRPSEARRATILASLEATVARLEAATSFAWRDPVEAAHEENRFERDAGLLGEQGAALWERFDREMERLYALRAASDEDVAKSVA